MIAPEPGQVFYHNAVDAAAADILHHALKSFAVKIHAGFSKVCIAATQHNVVLLPDKGFCHRYLCFNRFLFAAAACNRQPGINPRRKYPALPWKTLPGTGTAHRPSCPHKYRFFLQMQAAACGLFLQAFAVP